MLINKDFRTYRKRQNLSNSPSAPRLLSSSQNRQLCSSDNMETISQVPTELHASEPQSKGSGTVSPRNLSTWSDALLFLAPLSISQASASEIWPHMSLWIRTAGPGWTRMCRLDPFSRLQLCREPSKNTVPRYLIPRHTSFLSVSITSLTFRSFFWSQRKDEKGQKTGFEACYS